MAQADTSAETYEEQHVHSVYESIASHFSATRYKVRILLPERITLNNLELTFILSLGLL